MVIWLYGHDNSANIVGNIYAHGKNPDLSVGKREGGGNKPTMLYSYIILIQETIYTYKHLQYILSFNRCIDKVHLFSTGLVSTLYLHIIILWYSNRYFWKLQKNG